MIRLPVWTIILLLLLVCSSFYLYWRVDQLAAYNTELSTTYGTSILDIVPTALVNINEDTIHCKSLHSIYNNTTTDALYSCDFYPTTIDECLITLPIAPELLLKTPKSINVMTKQGQSDGGEMSIYTMEIVNVDVKKQTFTIQLYANSMNDHVFNITLRFVYAPGLSVIL